MKMRLARHRLVRVSLTLPYLADRTKSTSTILKLPGRPLAQFFDKISSANLASRCYQQGRGHIKAEMPFVLVGRHVMLRAKRDRSIWPAIPNSEKRLQSKVRLRANRARPVRQALRLASPGLAGSEEGRPARYASDRRFRRKWRVNAPRRFESLQDNSP